MMMIMNDDALTGGVVCCVRDSPAAVPVFQRESGEFQIFMVGTMVRYVNERDTHSIHKKREIRK
jgi:hypothetical protein